MAANDILLNLVPTDPNPNDIRLLITGGPSTTEDRFTQVGLEAWTNFVSPTEARFTQAGLEVWGASSAPEARFSQVGLEVWILSDDQLRRLVSVHFV